MTKTTETLDINERGVITLAKLQKAIATLKEHTKPGPTSGLVSVELKLFDSCKELRQELTKYKYNGTNDGNKAKDREEFDLRAH